MAVDSSDLTMEPTTTIALDDVGSAKKVLQLIDALEELDDVQSVHSNFDVADDVLAKVEV